MTSKKRMFLTFCVIGVINTIIDFALYLALQKHGVEIYLANIVSTSAALAVSYVLNKRFTYDAAQQSNRAFVPFVVITLIGLWVLQPIIIYAVRAGLDVGAVRQLLAPLTNDYDTLRNAIGKLAATPATLIWNFVLYKKYVFKDGSLSRPASKQRTGKTGDR